MYWDAAPSQWYAEPKRLEAHGYLAAHKTPGRTRERTHYTLTERGREALAEWVRTPATLPRIQNEPVIRLAAADLVDPAAVLEGLEAMRPDLEAALAGVAGGQARAADITHRAHLLEVNHRYAQKLLALQEEWLASAAEARARRGRRPEAVAGAHREPPRQRPVAAPVGPHRR